jgi:hypothetical protein
MFFVFRQNYHEGTPKDVVGMYEKLVFRFLLTEGKRREEAMEGKSKKSNFRLQ